MQDRHTGDWTPQPVMMKLHRAALCVAWSPSEDKFAIGSGKKNVCVCSFNRNTNWWGGELIRQAHDSSVCCIAWHPDDACLATGSTDGHCRIFWASSSGAARMYEYTSCQVSDLGEWARASLCRDHIGRLFLHAEDKQRNRKFGDLLYRINLGCWVNSLSWSPDGRSFAAAGHDKNVHMVEGPMDSAHPPHAYHCILFSTL